MLVYLSVWIFTLESSDVFPVTVLTHSVLSKGYKVEFFWFTRLQQVFSVTLNFSLLLLKEKSVTILNITISY